MIDFRVNVDLFAMTLICQEHASFENDRIFKSFRLKEKYLPIGISNCPWYELVLRDLGGSLRVKFTEKQDQITIQATLKTLNLLRYNI